MIDRISVALTDVLTNGMKDVVTKPNQIGVYLPHEHKEAILGLYLYSIRSCDEVNAPAIAAMGRNIKGVPPRFFTLYYLMTAYSNAELAFRAVEEQRILTRAMEVFEKTPILTQKELGFKPGIWVDELKLQFVDNDVEQVLSAWDNHVTPYRLSVVYKVCPVELNTTFSRKSQRIEASESPVNQQ